MTDECNQYEQKIAELDKMVDLACHSIQIWQTNNGTAPVTIKQMKESLLLRAKVELNVSHEWKARGDADV